MIIDKLDLKNNRVTLKVDSLDDLVFLKKIIEPQDLVLGRSSRKIKLSEADEKQRTIKKTVFILIRVEKVELSRRLRILGSVESEIEGIAMHSAHSIELDIGSKIEIEKPRWKNYQIGLIEQAKVASKAPQALVCVLDDEQASFAHITSSGYTSLGSINLRLSKKRYQEDKNQSEKDINKVVTEIINRFKENKVDLIILGSPLFWKEIVKKALEEKNRDIAQKVSLEDVSSGDEAGIRELIAGNSLNKILKNNQLAKEDSLINEMLELLAKKSSLIVYGLNQSKTSAEMGAIEIILISEDRLDGSEEINNLIDNVEQNRGQVHLISSTSPAGKKLNGLKGIVAKLRFNA